MPFWLYLICLAVGLPLTFLGLADRRIRAGLFIPGAAILVIAALSGPASKGDPGDCTSYSLFASDC